MFCLFVCFVCLFVYLGFFLKGGGGVLLHRKVLCNNWMRVILFHLPIRFTWFFCFLFCFEYSIYEHQVWWFKYCIQYRVVNSINFQICLIFYYVLWSFFIFIFDNTFKIHSTSAKLRIKNKFLKTQNDDLILFLSQCIPIRAFNRLLQCPDGKFERLHLE